MFLIEIFQKDFMKLRSPSINRDITSPTPNRRSETTRHIRLVADFSDGMEISSYGEYNAT